MIKRMCPARAALTAGVLTIALTIILIALRHAGPLLITLTGCQRSVIAHLAAGSPARTAPARPGCQNTDYADARS